MEEYAHVTMSKQPNPWNFAADGHRSADEPTRTDTFFARPMMTNPTNMDVDDRRQGLWIDEAYNYPTNTHLKKPYQARAFES